jgi:hypothetical protein
MVTGAFADPPLAVLIAAVAVNTSPAACPCEVEGVISKAPESTVAPIVLYVTVMVLPSRESMERRR